MALIWKTLETIQGTLVLAEVQGIPRNASGLRIDGLYGLNYITT